MEIGLLGGTFDPVHLGHLIIAEAVREKLALSRVIFIPAGRPWLKVDREVTAVEHRLRMVELAIGGNPYFEVSTYEVGGAGPSYSVDTVAFLRKELGPKTGLYFIVGADALAELPRWRDPASLAAMCWIIGVGRPGAKKPEISALEEAIPGISPRIKLVDVPQIGISSIDIRQRVKKGFSLRYLVPTEVENYIYEHRLYL
jgi:nicotinate-nucleotide adenylyltransferase